jgi:hypothetical protein
MFWSIMKKKNGGETKLVNPAMLCLSKRTVSVGSEREGMWGGDVLTFIARSPYLDFLLSYIPCRAVFVHSPGAT